MINDKFSCSGQAIKRMYFCFISSKELQLLVVLNVLATLYQDVNLTDVQDEKIPKSRRKALSAAIKDNVDKVWTLVTNSLVVSYNMLCYNDAVVFVLQSSSPFLLVAAMETISCYWLHMPLSSILQSGIPLIIISHLATESLQNTAIKAMIVIVNRKVCLKFMSCLQ